jgi:hypothetical protein
MLKHEHHSLLFHDDAELASILGAEIRERVTLHEWPLSSVQRVVTADGRRVIYKSQWGPTVEPEFYARAKSRLLPWAETIYRSDSHACMLIEFIDAPAMEDLGLPDDERARRTAEAAAELADIEGDLPHFLDISDGAKWLDVVESTIRDLSDLVDQGKFELTTHETVRTLDRCARLPEVVEAASVSPGLVHGDFGYDNLFVLPDGYRVIDWQRPKRGPSWLDLPGFRDAQGAEPPPSVRRGLIGISKLLGVNWLTQCKKTWITDATSYDAGIARHAEELRDELC